MGLFSSPAGDLNRRRPKAGIRLLLSILAQDFFHLVTLNALFLVFSLPILTMPAACAAMTRVSGFYVQETACNQWKEFLRAFRSELFRAVPAGLPLLLLPSLLCYAGIQFVGDIWSAGPYLTVAACFSCAALLVMMRYYYFPQLAWTNATAREALKNSFLFAAIRLPRNLPLLFVHAAGFAAAVYFFPLSSPYLVLFFFSSLNLFSTFLAWDGIRAHVLTDAPASPAGAENAPPSGSAVP